MKRRVVKDPNKVYRRISVRLFPTEDQLALFYKHIHSCRFIWNCMITIQERCYKLYNRRYTYDETSAILTDLKHQDAYAWLNEVSRHSLDATLNDLDNAYKQYRKDKNAGLPRYKRKRKSKKAFPARDEFLYFNDGHAYIEKIGMVKYKSDRSIPEGRKVTKFRDARVFLSKNNKWILSFVIECDKQAPKDSLYGNMGIDMGIRRLATFSYLHTHEYIPNINKSRRVRTLRHKLKHLHKKAGKIYHMHKNNVKSKHIIRIENQMRKVYHRVSNITKNYNHMQTRQLVNLCPRKVIMEDFEVKKLTRNMPRWMRREIYYASWYDFKVKMEYKCDELGIQFILASKEFPSTQICSECGHIKHGSDKLKLDDHVYVCKKCGLKLNRDINAARNLEWYGKFN